MRTARNAVSIDVQSALRRAAGLLAISAEKVPEKVEIFELGGVFGASRVGQRPRVVQRFTSFVALSDPSERRAGDRVDFAARPVG